MPEITLTSEVTDAIGQAVAKAALEMKNGSTEEEKNAIFDEETKSLPHRSEAGQKVVGKFIKGLFATDAVEKATIMKDLGVTTDSAGGYTTPTEFRSALIEKKYKLPYIRRYATALPMMSDKIDLPSEGNTFTAYWPGENTAITSSDPSFGNTQLVLNPLGVLTRMSRLLAASADINPEISDFLLTRMASVQGREEDKQFMTGDGSGKPTGIRGFAGVASVAQAGANLAYDDFVNIEFALPRQYRERAVFIMHDSIVKLLKKLKDTTGRPIFERGEGSGIGNGLRTPDTLLGYPILYQDDIPTNLGGGTNESEITFCDLSYYFIGDGQSMSVETSTQEGNSFAKHQVALKAVSYVDGKPGLAEAFAKLTAVK